MQMIVFDVHGSMAHFRRFYSNVTSLSYRFPPRNTVAGLIAAILGLEKDSYYDVFSRERCGIAVALRTPVRILPFSINYLDIDSLRIKTLRGKGWVPTVLELVLPSPPYERLCYRVFFTHNEQEILKEIWARLTSRRYVYPPSLGPAYCLAEIEPVFFAEEIELIKEKELQISTVIREDLIARNGITLSKGLKILREERLPPDFDSNRGPVGESMNYIFEAEGKPINIWASEAFKISLPEGDVFGIFM